LFSKCLKLFAVESLMYINYFYLFFSKYMVNCFEDDGQWFVTTQPHVKQIDSASCGVFCLSRC